MVPVSFLRKILFPFSLLFGAVTGIRNWAYDRGWLASVSFPIPVIAVGNLSVGGTGKTPMIEYLLRLLQQENALAVLSRGYGRKTRGYLLADSSSTADTIGDEPMQYFRKFRTVQVAVDEKRVRGIQNLLSREEKPEVVLLDDAFQHRQVRAGLYILLSAYGKLFTEDCLLPAGNLRESAKGARRADVIVITKCPEGIRQQEKDGIRKRIAAREGQKVFFSTIAYHDKAVNQKGELPLKELRGKQVLLVTGIADAAPLKRFLSARGISFRHLEYGDHEQLSRKHVDRLLLGLGKAGSAEEILLTTEKDYVRNFEGMDERIYYLPIRLEILETEESFNHLIIEYVRESKGNS